MQYKQSKEGTKVSGESVGVEFIGDELGSIKDYPKPSQSFTNVPISGGKLIQSQGLDRYGFVRPV